MVEHVKLLVSRGHNVIAVHRSDTADTAMPHWTNVVPSVDIVCRLHQRLGDVYPASDIDVVVVGIFHQVWLAACAKGIKQWLAPCQFGRQESSQHQSLGVACCFLSHVLAQ